jgi:hypothetical protein
MDLVAHHSSQEVGNFGDRLRGVSMILVNTPDHRDFSEDTYRVFSAENLKLDALCSEEGDVSDSPSTSPV